MDGNEVRGGGPHGFRGPLLFFLFGGKVGEMVKPCWGQETEVSVLSNYFQYFVEGAFILKESGGFRLVVQRQGAVACKEEFMGADEARTAFLDYFGYKDEEIERYFQPRWSEFSRPKELTLKPHVKLVMEYALGSIQC